MTSAIVAASRPSEGLVIPTPPSLRGNDAGMVRPPPEICNIPVDLIARRRPAGPKPARRERCWSGSSLEASLPFRPLGVPVRRLILLAFIWGWSFLFIKVILEDAPPTFLAWGRIVLGLAVLVVAMRRRREPLPERRYWGHLAGPRA